MSDNNMEELTFDFVEHLEVTDPERPKVFPVFDETIETEYCCPMCGYEWSGQAKVSAGTSLIEED